MEGISVAHRVLLTVYKDVTVTWNARYLCSAQGRYPWKDGYALWADCFLFVYSITDRDSFQELSQLKRQVENVRKSASLTAMLVANKNDLLHDRQVCVRQLCFRVVF